MAYPFTQFPTFAELRDRLTKEFNCQFKQKTATFNGKEITVDYFERVVNDNLLECVVDFKEENERVAPLVLRSICVRLQIDPKEFGFALG